MTVARELALRFVSGGHRVAEDHPDYLRIALINLIGLVAGLVWAVFLVRNAVQLPATGNWARVAFDACGVVFSIAMVLAMHAGWSVDWTARLVNAAILVAVLGLVQVRPDPGPSMLVAGIFPPVSFLLLDRVRAGAVSVALMTIALDAMILGGVGPWAVSPVDPVEAVMTVTGIMLLFGVTMGGYISSRRHVLARLEELRRELARESVHDPLTGLYNRRLFDGILEGALARAARQREALAVLMLDLDRFKAYNDAHGHPAGDRLLQEVAGALRECFGRGDDVVFRLGGEEFCVVFFAGSAGDAERLADRALGLVEALDEPAPAGPRPRVTVSGGLAVVEGGSRADPEAVYRAADDALYRAKSAGRARWVRAEPPGAEA